MRAPCSAVAPFPDAIPLVSQSTTGIQGAARRLTVGLMVTAALACSSSGDHSTGPAVLTITPATPTVLVGNSTQLSAAGATGPLTWSTSQDAVATVTAGLVAGVSRGTAAITASDGTNSGTANVTVTLPPTIGLSAAALNFATTANGAVPGPLSVAVQNVGDGSVDGLALGATTYSAGASGWLSATITPASAPAVLQIQPITASLASGSYTATAIVASSTAVNSPRALTVTYTVAPTPIIQLGHGTATFSAQVGGAVPASQGISIVNAGGDTLRGLQVGTVTYSAAATNWLSASINPTTAPATLSIVPTTTALPQGTYTATVPVASTIPGVAPVSLTVTYQVIPAPPPPSIVLGSTRAGFTAITGSPIPSSQTLTVTNGGSGTLSGLTAPVMYTNGQPSGWLTATLGSAAAPTMLTMQPNVVLAAGTYTGTVAVTSGVASNSPQLVTVTYVVTAPPAIGLAATSASFSSTATNVDPAMQMIGVSNTGGGTLSGLLASVSYGQATTGWLSASVAGTAPLAPSTTPLTLQVTTGTIAPGTYTATVTVSGTGVASRTVAVTFTRIATLGGDILTQVFQASCAFNGCHGAVGANEDVVLATLDTAYASLVNRHAESPPNPVLVIPGDSLGSYLIKQLKQTSAPQDVMPQGCGGVSSPCLDPTVVHLIAVWIQQGARKSP